MDGDGWGTTRQHLQLGVFVRESEKKEEKERKRERGKSQVDWGGWYYQYSHRHDP